MSGSPLLFVVFGPGGAGKGTVIRRLLERDGALWLSRSWTTRARRPGEAADAYSFVDRRTFEDRIASGGFLEWATVLDDLYGTPVPEPPPGCDVVLEIDVQGLRQVRERHPDSVAILLEVPSTDVQAERLRTRGDPEEHVQRRIQLGLDEVEQGRPLADHVVVNDDLESAVDQLSAIIDAARRRARRA